MADVKLIKINEVFIKVECETSILYEMNDVFSFYAHNYKFMPSFRNKIWDGKIRMINLFTRLVYFGMRQKIHEFCKEREYSIEDNIEEPYQSVDLEKWLSIVTTKYKPRDYQLSAFEFSIKNNRATFISPTASGKSYIIYMTIERMRLLNKRTLIIVPTISLVSQMASDFYDYGYQGNINKIIGGKEKDNNEEVVVSTWQSIFRLHKNWFSLFDCIIVDEVHLATAKSITGIMEKLERAEYRYGYTGTLSGSQVHEMTIEGLFGPIKKVTTTAELIQNNTLADLKIKAILFEYPDDIKKLCKKYTYKEELSFIISNNKRNKMIGKMAKELKGNTLVLFQYIAHGQELFDIIKNSVSETRKVFFIYGKTNADIREDIRKLVEYESDAIIVASILVFGTGTNIRNLHNVVFTTPSKSRVRVLQAIGRGLRRSDTKTEMTLYDIVDDLSWKSQQNVTLKHFIERISMYNSEKLDYKIYKINLG